MDFFLSVNVQSAPNGKISFVNPQVLITNSERGPAETTEVPGEAAARIKAKIFTPGPQTTGAMPSYSFMDVHQYIRKAVLKASGFKSWKEFPKNSTLEYSNIYCREALLKKSSGKQNKTNWRKYNHNTTKARRLVNSLKEHGFKLGLEVIAPVKKRKS